MSILDKFKKEESKDKKKQTTKKKVEKKVEKSKARIESKAHKILLYPQISEKATYLGEENKYVFIVSTSANKKEIKQAIKDVYGIKPLSVNTIKVGGKERRYGKNTGKTVGYKKAIVALPEGETIQLYDGV
ncbi:MAG: 50S ribosomal protein L23 [Parcubacteria group bacterium]|nr:50S ribosomal protein L23 [Parcubacteria group bacterium]